MSNEYHIDYAGMQGVSSPGFTCVAFYTPHGIQKMDSLFVKRIMAYHDGKEHIEYSYNYSFTPPKKEVENVYKDTYETLFRDITENPHFHPKLKENLLSNLNNG